MKKTFILTFVILCIYFDSIAQKAWNGSIINFTRVEINIGVFQSIKLSEDGLYCNTVYKGKTMENFFYIRDLDFNILLKLQNFLQNDSFFYKDTIITQTPPNMIISHPSCLDFYFVKNYKISYIQLTEGDNEKLKVCIDLLNELIPKHRYKKLYSISIKTKH